MMTGRGGARLARIISSLATAERRVPLERPACGMGLAAGGLRRGLVPIQLTQAPAAVTIASVRTPMLRRSLW